MKFINIFMFIIVSLFLLNGCATLQEKSYKEHLQYAYYNIKQNDYYEAVNQAITALRYEYKGEEARQIIDLNYNKALNQAQKVMLDMSVNVNNYVLINQLNNEISSMQIELKKMKVINEDLVNGNMIAQNYKNQLADKIIDEAINFLAKNDIEGVNNQIRIYRELKAGQSTKYNVLLSNVLNKLLENKDYNNLKIFAVSNKPDLKDEDVNIIVKVLYKYACNDDITGNKRRALSTLEVISELDKGNVLYKDKIIELKKESVFRLAITDIGNYNDDILSFTDDEIKLMLKNGIDDTNNLIEVDITDITTNELRDLSIDNDYFKQHKNADLKLRGNINAILAPKITSLKIDRPSPMIVTKTAQFDDSDGNPFVVGMRLATSYSGNVNHFEYTEYTEKVKGRISLDMILYDVSTKKFIIKDRIETVAEDSATWADNPMAVGTFNKTPATYCPSKITMLMNKKHSVTSDEELRKELIRKSVDELIKKIKTKIINL